MGNLHRKSYECYHKLREQDEDLSTTVANIRVLCAPLTGTRVLTRITGRSVFRRDFCLYHRLEGRKRFCESTL